MHCLLASFNKDEVCRATNVKMKAKSFAYIDLTLEIYGFFTISGSNKVKLHYLSQCPAVLLSGQRTGCVSD